MDNTLTWDHVIANKALIGGYIEMQEGGCVYRGPLREIKDDNGQLEFISPWIARLNPETTKWEKWPITSFSTHRDVSPPQDIGGGRVFFTLPYLGPCTIFPKGGSKLDPSKVEGLEKASLRFLALYPDLPLDRAVVEKVLVAYSFPKAFASFRKWPPGATMQDLLNCFYNDSSAEEFLWHYVEAVTGEKFPHNRVY